MPPATRNPARPSSQAETRKETRMQDLQTQRPFTVPALNPSWKLKLRQLQRYMGAPAINETRDKNQKLVTADFLSNVAKLAPLSEAGDAEEEWNSNWDGKPKSFGTFFHQYARQYVPVWIEKVQDAEQAAPEHRPCPPVNPPPAGPTNGPFSPPRLFNDGPSSQVSNPPSTCRIAPLPGLDVIPQPLFTPRRPAASQTNTGFWEQDFSEARSGRAWTFVPPVDDNISERLSGGGSIFGASDRSSAGRSIFGAKKDRPITDLAMTPTGHPFPLTYQEPLASRPLALSLPHRPVSPPLGLVRTPPQKQQYRSGFQDRPGPSHQQSPHPTSSWVERALLDIERADNKKQKDQDLQLKEALNSALRRLDEEIGVD